MQNENLFPLVSILIPVYNGANYMAEAIESALCQTYQNKEIIVINDGSNDDGKTDSIAKSYGDKIRYVTKENGGVATALNAGIRMARGAYVSWLSHDDLYRCNKIERQISYVMDSDDDSAIIYSDYDAIDSNGKTISSIRLSEDANGDYFEKIIISLFRSDIHGCSILIPKACFEEVGYFDESLRTTQDYNLWFRFLHHGYTFRHIPESLICSRWHSEQGTHSMSELHVREVEELYIWAFELFYKKISRFSPQTVLELITILRKRTLSLSPDYILKKIKVRNTLLYARMVSLYAGPLLRQYLSKLRQRIFFSGKPAGVGTMFSTMVMFVARIVPQSVKDRYFYFIKVGRKEEGRIRILFVALPESLHTARWINQFKDKGWDLHIFPALDTGKVHPDIDNVTIYYSAYGPIGKQNKPGNRYRGLYVPSRYGAVFASFIRNMLNVVCPSYRKNQLSRLISRLNPDLVHSIEFQNSAYLTYEVRQSMTGVFPKWLVTNYGNDIFLYGRLKSHKDIIRRILSSCDYYSCECNRDVDLAREFGFKGEVLPVFPNTGGYDLQKAQALRSAGRVSDRRIIMMKGYGMERGRAIVALRAIERCADLIKEQGYSIVIYLATYDVVLAAELVEESTGIPIKVYPMKTGVGEHHYALTHDEMLAFHGKARIAINNNISDGIAISLLDAMVMGAFPIHSTGACGNEWFEDGVSGFIVSPNDPDNLECAIRTALTDDTLVNVAATINWKTSVERLDHDTLKEESMKFYDQIFK